MRGSDTTDCFFCPERFIARHCTRERSVLPLTSGGLWGPPACFLGGNLDCMSSVRLPPVEMEMAQSRIV